MKLVYHPVVAGLDEHAPLEELIPVLAAAGIDAVEANSSGIRWFERGIDGQLDAIRTVLSKTDFEVYSVHGPWGDEIDWSSTDVEMRELAQGMLGSVIECSAELGASIVVIHPGKIGERETEAAYVERLANNVAPLVVTTEAEGVTLALENLPHEGERAELMAKVVRLADTARLVVCLDTGHAHLAEGVAAAVKAAGEVIGHIHIHDNNGQGDQHWLPGMGTINWKDLAPLLGSDSDYQGAVVLEARRPEGLKLADLHKKMCEFVLA